MKKIVLPVLVLIGALVVFQFCCPRTAQTPAPEIPVAATAAPAKLDVAALQVRDDIVGYLTLRSAGLQPLIRWIESREKKDTVTGWEGLAIWARERSSILQSAKELAAGFQDLTLLLSPEIVRSGDGQPISKFAIVSRFGSTSKAQEFFDNAIKEAPNKVSGNGKISKNPDGSYDVEFELKPQLIMAGRLWLEGERIFSIFGTKSKEDFFSTNGAGAGFKTIGDQYNLSEPVLLGKIDAARLKTYFANLSKDNPQFKDSLDGISNRLTGLGVEKEMMFTIEIDGNSFKRRVCYAGGFQPEVKSTDLASSRFGSLLSKDTVLSYHADGTAIKGAIEGLLSWSDSMQKIEEMVSPPDAAKSDKQVALQSGAKVLKAVDSLLPQKAEFGVAVELPPGGVTPIVMGYLGGERFDAVGYIKDGEKEFNAAFLQAFGDYTIQAKSYQRDGVDYLNFSMGGVSQPVYMRAAGTTGIAIGMSEEVVDMSVRRLASSENQLASVLDASGQSIWTRYINSSSSTYLNLQPVVRLARPFLPLVIGNGERLPQGMSPEDVDFIAQNLGLRVMGTTHSKADQGVRCDDSLWEVLQ